MRKIHYDRVLILSATLSDKSADDNHKRNKLLRDMLDELNITYNWAVGCYKGEVEESLVVLPKDNVEINTVMLIAFNQFKQESVLIQDTEGKAYLRYHDAKTMIYMGKLRAVPKALALKQDGYTVMNDRYYAIVS